MSGKVVAFYGFKGGAGRSFLMANMAALLAANGRTVLIIDADLEAPGLGDFFDVAGNAAIRRSTSLYSEWRLKKGFLDLVTEITSPQTFQNGEGQAPTRATVSDIEAHIREVLNPNALYGLNNRPDHPYLTQIGPYSSEANRVTDEPVHGSISSAGGLYLMGAGDHGATLDEGSFGFLRKILEFDWVVQTNAHKDAFKALKSVLSGDLFDYVFLDGRTGYNTASIVAIQKLATDLVMVGTPSAQSIDGIARMRRIFEGRAEDPDSLNIHMVLSKTPLFSDDDAENTKRANEDRYKRDLNKDYLHPNKAFFEFPFVTDFASGDAILFSRSKLDRNRSDERDRSGVQSYIDALQDLTRDMLGVTGEVCSRRGVERAFNSWRVSDVAEEAGGALGATFERTAAPQIDREQRDAAIEKIYKSIQRFLQEYRKPFSAASLSSQTTQQTPETETGVQSVPDQLTRIKRNYLSLYPAERSYLQAMVKDFIVSKSNGLDVDARRLVAEHLALRVLPNLSRRAELVALGLDPSVTQEQLPDTPQAQSSPAKNVSTIEVRQNKKELRGFCRKLLGGRPDDVVVVRAEGMELLSATSNIDADYRSAVRLLLDVYQLAPEDSIACMELFQEVLTSGNIYLPADLEELSEVNILDVCKLALNNTEVLGVSAAVRKRVKAIAALCLDHFASTFARNIEDGADTGIIQIMVDAAAWLQIFARTTVLKSELGYRRVVALPDHDIIRPFIDLVEKTLSSDDRSDAVKLFAVHLRIMISNLDEDDASVVRDLETAVEISRNIKPGQDVGAIETALGFLSNQAIDAGHISKAWRLERAREGIALHSSKAATKTSYDYQSFLSATILADKLGIPTWSPPLDFPLFPEGLIDRDRSQIENEAGWFRQATTAREGNHQGIIKELRKEFENPKPETAKLAWLAASLSSVGEIEEAMEVFDKWLTDTGAQKSNPSDGFGVFARLTNSVLDGLLAKKDFAGFLEFYDRTGWDEQPILTAISPVSHLKRRVLHFSYLSKNGTDVPEADLAHCFSDLMAACRQIEVPTDAAFSEICGSTWDGLGAFSGLDAPAPLRAELADLILELQSVIDRPVDAFLATTEKLLWESDKRHAGEVSELIPSSFLKPISTALCRPKARLEVLRNSFGLPASLEIARAAFEEDCADPVEETVGNYVRTIGNGLGRAIYYPEELTRPISN